MGRFRRKPERITLSLTDMNTAAEDVVTARKAMWAEWIDECTMAQEALIEDMLFQIPSLAKNDG